MDVATAIIRVAHPGRPTEDGTVYIERSTTYVVRFPFLPPTGLRVCLGAHAWVVEGVECEMLHGRGPGELAVAAHVHLVEVTDAPYARQTGHGVPVWVIDEGQQEDETYEGERFRFPALPRVGEEFLDHRHQNTRPIRYVVQSVEHLAMSERDGPRSEYRIEHQVVIRKVTGETDRWSRRPRPSRN